MLTQYGVDDGQRLVDRFGEDRCREQLAAMPTRIADYARRNKPIDNPAGYLREAIERGYRIPVAIATAARRDDAAEKQRLREAEEFQERQYAAACDKLLADLQPAQMARFRARAEQQILAISPFFRNTKIPAGMLRAQIVKIIAGAAEVAA